MTSSESIDQTGQPINRRLESRTTKLSNHGAEFKLVGVPIYQLKVRDLSAKGAGIVARADSVFLKMIRIGQELDVKLVSFGEAKGPSGYYRSRIEHISELKEGRFKGHMVVGISILAKRS
ncbi:MAG: hypothetical protein HY895_18210 [Deltaproteobacteria bacterium]|nr:hypothetical protein [Deltaproteobacteria bacterium]